LDVNSKKVVRRARKGRPIRQVAAVPFRLTSDGELQVMLITSRSTQRFIVPKGWRMKGKSAREAAGVEAFEEAGVSGRLLKQPAGSYRYWKRLSKHFVPVDVTVYLLSVEDELGDWGEAGARQRAWLAPVDAATLIDEPELASMVGSLKVPQEA
jgi:8-oxo-dGTP pyrophosphatase MutT (NUDIX family)